MNRRIWLERDSERERENSREEVAYSLSEPSCCCLALIRANLANYN